MSIFPVSVWYGGFAFLIFAALALYEGLLFKYDDCNKTIFVTSLLMLGVLAVSFIRV